MILNFFRNGETVRCVKCGCKRSDLIGLPPEQMCARYLDLQHPLGLPPEKKNIFSKNKQNILLLNSDCVQYCTPPKTGGVHISALRLNYSLLSMLKNVLNKSKYILHDHKENILNLYQSLIFEVCI